MKDHLDGADRWNYEKQQQHVLPDALHKKWPNY
jgi:hypothetical protein